MDQRPIYIDMAFGFRPRSIGIIFVAILQTGVLLFMNNCNRVQLVKVEPSNSVLVSKGIEEICAASPVESSRKTKIVFLIDMSGSNVIGNIGEPTPTDPNKSYRYNTIRNFVEQHKDNPDIYYSLIVFQGTKAIPLTKDEDSNPTFTNEANKMLGALENFRSMADDDYTPYKAALTLASTLIQSDRKQMIDTNQKVFYGTVLVSDGVPTDYGQPAVNDDQLDLDVKNLVLSGGDATFSTVYYGPDGLPTDLEAANRLKRIANIGNGNFIDTNIEGRNIPMDSIIAYTENEPWKITHFFVSNLNVAPCDDGAMDTDSDADGLCDRDELRYNLEMGANPSLAKRMNGNRFDPTKRNSFANNYNDYFNWRNIQYGEQLDRSCTTETSSSADIISDCEKGFIKSLTPVGPTAEWTRLMGYNADPNNFDSDGDGYLDGIEFQFTRERSSPIDFSSTMAKVNDITIDKILSEHRHPRLPARSIPYDGKFEFVRINALGQNCYTYHQKTLPLVPTSAVPMESTSGFPQLAHAASENVVLVYYIQKNELSPYGIGELHFSYQKFNYSAPVVSIDLDASHYNVFVPSKARAASAAGPLSGP